MRTVLAFFLTLLLCGLAFADGFRPVLKRTVNETRLATVSGSPEFAVSPKGSKLVYAEYAGETQHLVINGIAGTPYSRIISRPHFTVDDRLVYAVEKDGRPMMVFGDRECGPYDGLKQLMIRDSLPTVYVDRSDWKPADPNSREHHAIYWSDHFSSGLVLMSQKTGHAAWVAKRNGKQFVVLDGTESQPYDVIGTLTFSPDGRRFAYTAKIGKTWRMVIDGVAKTPYDSITKDYWTQQQAVFSADGKHLAYRVTSHGKERLIIDGRETNVDDPAFKRLFNDPERPFPYFFDPFNFNPILCINTINTTNAAQPPKEKYLNKENLLKHPDGRDWAFVAEVDSKKIVVIDGKESRKYDKILELQPLYVNRGLYYIALDGKKQIIVINGRSSRRYDKIGQLYGSPNRKRLAYFAKDGKEWVLVVDGKERIRHFSPEETSFTFSPDSRHYQYKTKLPTGESLYVVDGQKIPYPDAQYLFCFSPDGLLAVGEISDGGDYGFVVNGMKDRMYDRIHGNTVFFDGAGCFHYFASRGDEIFRVDEVVELKR